MCRALDLRKTARGGNVLRDEDSRYDVQDQAGHEALPSTRWWCCLRRQLYELLRRLRVDRVRNNVADDYVARPEHDDHHDVVSAADRTLLR